MTEKPTTIPPEINNEWSRTTVVLREEYLQKLKILTWWEKSTLKDLFDEMIREYLSSKTHLDRFFQEREKNIQEKKTIPKQSEKSV